MANVNGSHTSTPWRTNCWFWRLVNAVVKR